MVTRRQLLFGAGAGAAGLAIGVAADGVGRGAIAAPVTGVVSDAQVRENAGAAGPYDKPGRFGTRQVVWSTHPVGSYAAITFDDGPSPEFTPRILEALAAANVHATFFAMGWPSVRHPDLIRAILDGGHEVGNHTWSHLDQTTLDAPQIREEIVRAKDELERLTRSPLVGFRPPRGELTGYALKVCGELGYDTYMWSIERGPSGTSTPEAVTSHVVGNLAAGDIIDLHDGIGRGTFAPTAAFSQALAARREVEVRALPAILAGIAAKGITLTTVTDLMRRSLPVVHTGSSSA